MCVCVCAGQRKDSAHLEVGHMDQLSILVAGQNSEDSRPVTLEVFSIAHDLTLLGVKVGVRLQPPAHSSSKKLSTQAFPSSCY